MRKHWFLRVFREKAYIFRVLYSTLSILTYIFSICNYMKKIKTKKTARFLKTRRGNYSAFFSLCFNLKPCPDIIGEMISHNAASVMIT